MAILGSATYELDTDNSRLNRGLAEAEKSSRESARRVAGTFAKMGAGLLTVGAGIGFGLFRLAKAASSAQEAANAVNVEFEEGAHIIQKFAKNSAQAVGLASSDFMQIASQVGALFRNYGLSAEDAAKQTVILTTRAADLASVGDTSVKEALNAMASALRGETEPIRRFSVDVTDATLEMYLLSQGIEKSVTEMSQAEKGMHRYGSMMEQSNRKAGDFAATSGDAANSSKILAAQLKNAAAMMGQGLLPVLEPVLIEVRKVVTAFSGWAKDHPELVRVLVLSAAAVVVLATAIGGLALAVAGALLAFGALGVAGLITVGWIGVAALAVIALVAAGVWLVKNWDKVKKSLVSVFETVLAWVQPVVDAFDRWAENNPKLMRALVIARQAVDGLTMALGWLQFEAEEAWEEIKEMWEEIKTDAEDKLEEIKATWAEGGIKQMLLAAAAVFAASITATLAVWTIRMLSRLAVWTATSLARMSVWAARMLARFAAWTAAMLLRMALWPAKMLFHLAVWTVTSLAHMLVWRIRMLASFAVMWAYSLAGMALWVARMLLQFAAWTAAMLLKMGLWVAKMLFHLAVWTVTSLARMAAWSALMLARLSVWAARMVIMWLVAIGPVGWIALGVAALGAAALLLMLNWESIDGRWRKFWNGLKVKAVGVLNDIIDKINDLIELWNKIPVVPGVGDIGHVDPNSVGTAGLEDSINFATMITPGLQGLKLGTLLKKGAEWLGGAGGGEGVGADDIPGFARGGIVTGPTLARLGEAGPEAVVPLSGKVGMGGNLTILFQGDVYGGEDFGDRVRDAVDEATRRGVVFGAA